MANSRILVISDTHAPYHHPDTIKFLTAIKDKYKPDRVIHIGDEVDSHAMSFHTPDPDLRSPGDELKKARELLWQIEELYPRVTVLESNHGSLWYRKAMVAGIPREAIRSYEEILFPDWKTKWAWTFEHLETLPNKQPCYFHHGRSANSMTYTLSRGMSAVQGHFHEKYNIQYWGTNERLSFGMAVGCLVDDNSLAMAYNNSNLKRPIIGLGMIIDSQPRLLPLIMKANGRWNGKLT